ncbi:hypothetical protein E4U57_003605 [Claviceps arundinis]|uniref:Uncharacterized protein n=1 Tax=Claviceps arundinis TaxID=1623583 RepID=A0ABQ7PJK5_9HYPO|nr:hypothetical protein E4U57_003605 [Claviceps arundinis]
MFHACHDLECLPWAMAGRCNSSMPVNFLTDGQDAMRHTIWHWGEQGCSTAGQDLFGRRSRCRDPSAVRVNADIIFGLILRTLVSYRLSRSKDSRAAEEL